MLLVVMSTVNVLQEPVQKVFKTKAVCAKLNASEVSEDAPKVENVLHQTTVSVFDFFTARNDPDSQFSCL